MKLIPTKTQFRKWSLPAKFAYISFIIAFAATVLMVIFFVIQTSTGATKEGQTEAQSDRDAKHEEQIESINRVKTLVEKNANVKERPYVSEFSADDWVTVNGLGNQLRIPFSDHKVDNPIVTVQQKKENGNWQDVGCVIEIDEFNNVIISVIYGFDGRIVLK